MAEVFQNFVVQSENPAGLQKKMPETNDETHHQAEENGRKDYSSRPTEENANQRTNQRKDDGNINFVKDMELNTPQQYEDLTGTDMVGRAFHTLTDAQMFFSSYSKVVGHGLRKDSKKGTVKKIHTRRRWVCAAQGFRREKRKDTCESEKPKKREPRPLTRTGMF